MNKADIEFTVGLNTSPAEQKLSQFLIDVQSHKNRVQKLLDNPTQYSEQAYLSKLSKLETMQNRYGIDRVNINSNLPTNEYHRFMNLQNAVARYEREINKIAEKANSVISVANTYRTQKNTKDVHPGMFDERLKSITDMELDRIATLENKRLAHGAYETWKGITSNNILALPPPPSKQNQEALSEDNKTPSEQAKNVAEENKKDNDELKDKLALWGKIGATVYAIRKVLQGLAKAWRFGVETATGVNSNINEEGGYFSIDPEGALRANTDKTRSMLYAGIRNMGANSPVSKAGLDYASSKFTEMWTAAMSGRSVDAQTTIDAQRLKEFFGVDFTVAGLLTGEREGKTATDIQIDLMNSIEKNISKLAEADQTTKGQVIDSMKNILGDELVNAIVSNANKNLKIDATELKLTVSETLMQKGGSALPTGNLTEATTSVVTSLGLLKSSFQDLKNTIVVELGPAFSKLIDAITAVVNWVDKKITNKTVEGVAPNAVGATTPHNKDVKSTDEGGVFGNKADRKLSAQEKLKNATNANDVLDALYLLNPNLETEGDVENIKMRTFATEAIEALASGELDENSKNPLIKYLANYEYKGLKGLPALKKAEKWGKFGVLPSTNTLFRQAIKGKLTYTKPSYEYWLNATGSEKEATEYYNRAMKSYEAYMTAGLTDFMDMDLFGAFAKSNFGEGGLYDFSAGNSIYDYLLNPYMYESPEQYYNAISSFKDILMASKTGREYIQSFNLPSMEELAGKDKVLDFGEVVFTIKLTDEKGTVLSSRRVEGVVNELQ